MRLILLAAGLLLLSAAPSLAQRVYCPLPEDGVWVNANAKPKEISRVEDDMAFVNKKLGNPKFVERAPDHIVQKERDKLAGFEQEKSALESSMSELENLR